MASQEDKKQPKKFIVKMERSAQQAFVEEIFNDIYAHRLRIYWVNFVRGISFSVGGIIGATIVIALLVWILSLLAGVPVIGHFVHGIQQTLQGGVKK